MNRPRPVIVADLFPEERSHLLGLLRGLSDDQWHVQTACAGWTVKDVAAHLLGGDLGKLSRTRDGFTGLESQAEETFGGFINRINAEWVQAAKRLSPRVLCDLLEMSGRDIADLFGSLDHYETGEPVSWAGSEPAPVWLDVAREYTERWHHQQHIREAVGVPGLTEPTFMTPVISTFVWSLPHAFCDIEASAHAAVQADIQGDSGGRWAVVRHAESWQLYDGVAESPTAYVSMDQDIAWRLFTNGLSSDRARQKIRIEGDPKLGEQVLRAVAIIV